MNYLAMLSGLLVFIRIAAFVVSINLKLFYHLIWIATGKVIILNSQHVFLSLQDLIKKKVFEIKFSFN